MKKNNKILIEVEKNNCFKINGNMCSKMCNNFARYPKCFLLSNTKHKNIMNYCKNYDKK